VSKEEYEQFTISYIKEKEGGFSGHCIEAPGAISEGETLEELIENMKDAIILVLKARRKKSEAGRKELIIKVPTR
jgi:predicted RNase H-like HicB family nuclease